MWYLDIPLQYHSASDRPSSSELESHAPRTLAVFCLSRKNKNKQTQKFVIENIITDFRRPRTLVCTVLVGGGCALIKNDVLVFSREGKVLRDRRQGAGLALALVLVHLWIRRLCNIKCTALRVESWCQRRPGCRPSRGSLPALWDGSFGCLVLHQAGEFVQTRLLTDDTVGPPGIPEQALLHAQEYWPTLGAPGEPRLASPNKQQLSAVGCHVSEGPELVDHGGCLCLLSHTC